MGIVRISRRRCLVFGYIAGALSSGDGQDGFAVPFSAARVTNFGYALDVGGSGAGPNAVQLNRVRDESDSELLSATLDVAHDASTVSNEAGSGDFTTDNVLKKNDLVRLDLDGVATSAAGLGWWMELHIDQE